MPLAPVQLPVPGRLLTVIPEFDHLREYGQTPNQGSGLTLSRGRGLRPNRTITTQNRFTVRDQTIITEKAITTLVLVRITDRQVIHDGPHLGRHHSHDLHLRDHHHSHAQAEGL